MAAGVGEASAILAIAQLGISLSNSLISYIGDVQDAPFRIQRISNEVATTCERLRDIGQLVDKNHETHIFSEEGIHSAVRCSEECHKIIEEVKTVLQKGGWQQGSGALEKDEIDTSLFSTLRWPFLKRSLEVPRAELQRIKVDLSLLFSSAMALGASNAADKAKFCMDIPGLQKTREWAARMETRARQRAQNRHPTYTPRGLAKDSNWVDDDPEVMQEFVAYQERRMREEEDRKAIARAALLRAEEENKARLEEDARREIGREAVDAYKRNQDELQTRTQERKEKFRHELSRLGLQPSQINLIVDDSNLNFGDNGTEAAAPSVRPESPRTPSSGSTVIQTQNGFVEDPKKDSATHSTNGSGRRKLVWRLSRKDGKHKHLQEKSTASIGGNVVFETWLLDVYSSWKTKIVTPATLPEERLRQKKTGPDVWRCLAGLRPQWRTAVLDHMSSRNQEGRFEWGLYSIKVPQRKSRLNILRHEHHDQLLQVVLFCQSHSSDENFMEQEATTNQRNAAWMTPRSINRSSNLKRTQARNGLPIQRSTTRVQPKVTFAHEADQILKDIPTTRSSRNLRRFRHASEMKEAIKMLVETKAKLGPADQDRLDEINDMIVLLAAQLKLHCTLSWSQQEYWYHHVEKELPYELLEESYAPKQGGRPPKMRIHTCGREFPARNRTKIQTEEYGHPRESRDEFFRRDDKDLRAVPQSNDWYPLFEDGDLTSTYEIRRKPAVPEGSSNMIERPNIRRSYERLRPQMSHYIKDDYRPSSPERTTRLQREQRRRFEPGRPPLRQQRDERLARRARRHDDLPIEFEIEGYHHERLDGETRDREPFDWDRRHRELAERDRRDRELLERKRRDHELHERARTDHNLGRDKDRANANRTGSEAEEQPWRSIYQRSVDDARTKEDTRQTVAPGTSRALSFNDDRELPANENRALVLRDGGSYQALGEIPNRSIRVDREDQLQLKRVTDREWRRRSPRHTFSSTSSEDDEYLPFRDRSSSQSGTKLSDQQLITTTLQKYTTFQGDKLPVVKIGSELIPHRDDPLHSSPNDHQGHDAVNEETQDASAGALSLPSFNVPRRNSREVNHAYYPPVALSNRHTDGNRGNPATETSTQSTSGTGTHGAHEAEDGDTPTEPQVIDVIEINDASSDISERRRLQRQSRRATIEDAEAGPD